MLREVSDNQVRVVFQGTLFDDESVHTKLQVMNKVDAIEDDARNTDLPDLDDVLEPWLQLGYTYEFEIIVRKVSRVS